MTNRNNKHNKAPVEEENWRKTLDDNCQPLKTRPLATSSTSSPTTDLLYIQTTKDCNAELQEIEELKKQVATCTSNFSGVTASTLKKPVNAVVKEGFADMQEKISPFDIRKHRQYNQLLNSIKTEYIVTKRQPKAPPGPHCVPFANTDIRNHKDYQKMVQYIYKLASRKCVASSDIKSHADYGKLVQAIQKKTMQECSKNNNNIKNIKNNKKSIEPPIQQHPQYQKLVQALVRQTMEKYGSPVPGSSPVTYQRCNNNHNNNNNKSNEHEHGRQCLQKFGAQMNAVEGGAFDIKNHTQYRALIANVQQQCDQKIKRAMTATAAATAAAAADFDKPSNIFKSHQDISLHPDIKHYVLRANLSSPQPPEEGFTSMSMSMSAVSPSVSASSASVSDLKETAAQMLNLKILDKDCTRVVKDIHAKAVAVEQGTLKQSNLLKSPPPPIILLPVSMPAHVRDLQQMAQHSGQMAKNDQRIQKAVRVVEEAFSQQQQPQQPQQPSYIFENQLAAAKARIDNYSFQNLRLREELRAFRKKCNERIVTLWNEAQALRATHGEKKYVLWQQEQSLATKQRDVSALDQRVAEQHKTQQEKFKYYTALANSYKKELDTLKASLAAQNKLANNKITATGTQCSRQIEHFRKKYEETLKMLQEVQQQQLMPKKKKEQQEQEEPQEQTRPYSNTSNYYSDAQVLQSQPQPQPPSSKIQANEDDMMLFHQPQYALF